MTFDERASAVLAAFGISPGTMTQAVAAAIREAVTAETERCCAILASDTPNTRAEELIDRLSECVNDCPPHVAGLIAEWLEATADELADLQTAIRARGQR